MSKEIDNLIYLIENSLSDDNYLFNAEKTFSAYNPSPKGILNAFLQPGTEVLYLPSGELVDNVIKCTTAESTFDHENFSYQPYEFTKELDSAASFREQGPVYKTRNVGPRLHGAAAYKAYSDATGTAELMLVTEDSEEIKCTIGNSELKKKSFIRNKKKYVAVYIHVYSYSHHTRDGLIILKISSGNRRNPEESSARNEKIKMNRLNKINGEIEELETRLKELYTKKEKIESK